MLLIAAYGAGALSIRPAPAGVPTLPPAAAGDALDPLWQAWHLAETEYVGRAEVSRASLGRGAAQGLLDALGDGGHTRLVAADEYAQMQRALEGQWDGPGVRLTVRRRRPVVAEIYAGSLAGAAGLRVGDAVLDIDGEDTGGLAPEAALGRLRGGPPDAPVRLRVLRDGDPRPRDLEVARRPFAIPPVAWAPVPGEPVLHVAVRQFTGRAPGLVREAVWEAEAAGLRGLVLDLRGCPGGLTAAAAETAGEFLAGGTAFVEVDAAGESRPVPIRPAARPTALPVCVLVDEGTGSSAEILARALRDHGRARLVGTPTYGAGTILRPYPLRDGSVALVAVREWRPPSGVRIWHRGLTPDEEVGLPAGAGLYLPGATGTPADSGDSQFVRALTGLHAGPAPDPRP